MIAGGFVEQTDPLSPAFPLCSGSQTCERLLDSALQRAAGFFFAITTQTLDHTADNRRAIPNLNGQVWLFRLDSSEMAEG
jgi:hypothetical protein